VFPDWSQWRAHLLLPILVLLIHSCGCCRDSTHRNLNVKAYCKTIYNTTWYFKYHRYTSWRYGHAPGDISPIIRQSTTSVSRPNRQSTTPRLWPGARRTTSRLPKCRRQSARDHTPCRRTTPVLVTVRAAIRDRMPTRPRPPAGSLDHTGRDALPTTRRSSWLTGRFIRHTI